MMQKSSKNDHNDDSYQLIFFFSFYLHIYYNSNNYNKLYQYAYYFARMKSPHHLQNLNHLQSSNK